MNPEVEQSYRNDLFTGVRERIAAFNGYPDDAAIERIIFEESAALAADYPLAEASERDALAQELADEFLRLGPLEPFLADDNVTEVMINGAGYDEEGRKLPPLAFVEIAGRLRPVKGSPFESDEHLMRTIGQIGQFAGRSCTSANPIMDARLKDGSRVLATHPSVSPDGPSLTIRKFRKNTLSPADLVRLGSCTQEVMDFVASCVRARVNIFVTGPTASGKTSFLAAVASFIPTWERVILIEDPSEIQLSNPNKVRWEARPANNEGEGEVSIFDLVVASLRGRPDRIVVGEVRADEAISMLQAMTTGHDGSLSTLHANDPVTAFSRLRTMVQGAKPNMSIEAIDAMVGSAVELIVHVTRDETGFRHVGEVCAVEGYHDGVIVHNTLFQWVPGRGLVGQGIQPSDIRRKITASGGHYDERWFMTDEERRWSSL